MTVDLFAGVPVSDYTTAAAWYERLLGAPPAFLPNDVEAVWELADHRYVFIEVRPEHAGHAMHTVFVDDFDARIAAVAERGLEPADRETYDNGVRKATFRDPDGNEIGFGGEPAYREAAETTDPSTVPATADPSVAEDALAAQPIGYWSGAVHRAVVGRLRDAMAGIDVTQPQWWVLTRVRAGDGLTRGDVAAQLADVAETPHEVPRAVDQLLHRGWIEADGAHRLRLTDAGRTARRRIAELVTDLRAEIHDGISDEEYAVALTVMRRMMRNIGAAARPAG